MRIPKSTFFIILGLSSCSQEKLDPLEHFFITRPVESGVQVNFCTDPAQQVDSKLKYVFVFDHSGSNNTNYKINASTCEPEIPLDVQQAYGTDPTKESRYGSVGVPGTLLDFLANTPLNDPADPKVFFSLFTFSGNVSPWPNNNTFTSDVQAFRDRVQYTKDNIGDQGPTNYLDTLRAIQTLIQADINAAKACAARSVASAPTPTCPKPGRYVSSSYVIVFMSDGAPIVNVQLNPLVVTRQPSNEVLGTVAGIMGLAANTRYVDGINMFTIYYYQPINPDPCAAKLLRDMATVGNGVSYNVTSGSNIDYRRFTPPSRLIKFSLADVFVTNASAFVGTDGNSEADTDMDGIADSQETVIGSDPLKADSDRNGVTDLVEFAANGTPCGQKDGAGKCVRGSNTVDYRNNLCSSVPRTTVAGATVFSTGDPNGLNDCEKWALNDQAGVNNPDSNADLIPDWLQFKAGVPFQLGTSSAKDTQDSDGVAYYQKIKTSLPALTPYYRILNPKPTKYDMRIVSSSASQDCFQLQIDDLPMAGDDNMVRVDVVMRSPLLQDRFLYRVGKKRFAGSSKVLEINDWTDPAEIAAGTWQVWP